MKTIVPFFTFALLTLSGCSDHKNGEVLEGGTGVVKRCQNTFVVSGYTNDETRLFEHDQNSTNFHFVRGYKNGDYSFYDCKRNQLVSLYINYDKKGDDREGIRFYNIKNNSRTLYPTHDGFNGIIARYKDGFIFSSATVKIFGQGDNVPKLDYVKKEKNYYTEDKLFDLKRHRITETYPFSMWTLAEIIGDTLFVMGDTLLKVDLKTKKAEPIWTKKSTRTGNIVSLKAPRKSVTLFVNGIYYIISSSSSYDTIIKDKKKHKEVHQLKHFVKGAIYRVADNNISLVAKLPYNDIVYAVSPDKRHLYIFTESRKVINYDLLEDEIISTYRINTDIDNKYKLAVVGYTEENFIVGFEDDKYRDGYIVVADKIFSHISKPYRVRVGGMMVSTEKTVGTNSFRRNILK